MEIGLWIYFALTGGLWCFFYARATYTNLRLPVLAHSTDLRFEPRLSVIMTARNEADSLRPALETLLKQDYANLEIILVNDRSSDATGDIIDEFASRDHRIRTHHITHLPENWLGKTHALREATAMASGEWLLFTDADVHHKPQLWRQALTYAISEKLDQLALMPEVTVQGNLLKSGITAFGLLFLWAANIERIRDPQSQAAIGVGAFNLVRHSALNQTPGFEWLRMEVADDYGLGLLLKRAGFRCGFALTQNQLTIEWYRNLRQMVVGLEKNIMAPGTHYQTVRLILNPILLLLLISAPFISLLCLPSLYFICGLSVIITVLLCGCWMVRPPLTWQVWVLSPVGFLIIAYIFTRACLLCLYRDGICWRDTHYSRQQLREFQRVRL